MVRENKKIASSQSNKASTEKSRSYQMPGAWADRNSGPYPPRDRSRVSYLPTDPEEFTSPELQDTMNQQGFAERVLQTPENQQRLSDNSIEQEEELSSSSSNEEAIPTSGIVVTRAGRTSRPVQRLFYCLNCMF